MSEAVEKKVPVRNLERVGEKKFSQYIDAWNLQQGMKSATVVGQPAPTYAKVKIFARYDGTFDVVWYKKIEKIIPKEQVAESYEKVLKTDVVHGLKSKDRKKSPKKEQ